jgi:glutamyl-tRNA synthetase
MEKVRVRFAPSPTGPLHVGGVRTALYNYLFAKKHGGDFILRVEDTDQTRFVEGAENYVIESLKWCGIEPNEGQGFGGGEFGPYKQSERKSIYKQFADKMITDGTAYYAFDTPEELDKIRSEHEASKKTFAYDANIRDTMQNSLTLSEEEVQKKIAAGEAYVVRIKIIPGEEVRFQDLIRDWVKFDTATMDDKVLFKSDGLPTYHLANVVDDYHMKISHVIRGEEWLPSAPLHVLLYKYLGWENEIPQFAHLPLILKPTGKGKLSKRDGDAGGFPVFPLEWKDPQSGDVASGYREQGYFKEAFLNIMAFLGWNPGTEQELFTLDELVEAFSIERVGKSGARFDPEKAKWFQEQYLRAKSGTELASILKTRMNLVANDAILANVCDQMKERATFVEDIYESGKYFFEAPTEYDAKTVKKKWKEQSPALVADLINIFDKTEFNAEALETAFKNYVEENELGFGMPMIAIRLSITGVGGGPSLFEIMEVIGKEDSINRLKAGIENIKKEPVA